MKKCPYCFESIQDVAKKCRFCGEWLNEPKEKKTYKTTLTKSKKTRESSKKIVHRKTNKVESIDDPLSLLTEEEKKFIYTFSWGGFFAPTIMLLYTRQYGRAILCLILTIGGAVLGLIPRLIVGGNLRKKAYLNNEYDDFETYKEKVKNMETISTVLGIAGIILIIMFFSLLQ